MYWIKDFTNGKGYDSLKPPRAKTLFGKNGSIRRKKKYTTCYNSLIKIKFEVCGIPQSQINISI